MIGEIDGRYMSISLPLHSNPIYESIRHEIAIYSPHTALDVIDGGTSDILADLIDLKDRKPIEIVSDKPSLHS